MTDAIYPCLTPEDLAAHQQRLPQASAIVDALLGTGLRRDVSGWFLELIHLLNAANGPLKVAVDLPSGLDADLGCPRPDAFRADLTTTFAFSKLGLMFPDAAPFVGRLEVVDIGMPAFLNAQAPTACHVLCEEEIQQRWPVRSLNSHKGSFGHLLVVAGAPGKSGAALLTGHAALRAGVGLCTLATEPSVARQLEGRVPEIMCEGLPTPTEPTERPDLEALLKLCHKKSALAIGPGLSTSPHKRAWIEILLREFDGPIVLDADALNLLSPEDGWLSRREAPTILTPHPGEMARLRGTTTREIQADRYRHAVEFAQEHGVILVLKGARTLIASPDGRCWLNPTGNPGMATAGSGDVLTGFIGALIAQHVEPVWAACCGVFAHGMAADLYTQNHSMSGLVASDLFQQIPSLIGAWERHHIQKGSKF